MITKKDANFDFLQRSTCGKRKREELQIYQPIRYLLQSSVLTPSLRIRRRSHGGDGSASNVVVLELGLGILLLSNGFGDSSSEEAYRADRR